MLPPTVVLVVDHREMELVCSFPYDRRAVTRLKRLGSTYWDPDERVWRSPLHRIEEIRHVFWDLGYAIEDLTVEEAAVAKPAPPEDVFVTLMATVPDRLRDPVYRALARVLHPDAGGDGRLMQRSTTRGDGDQRRRGWREEDTPA